jgi:hypothetical protein
MHRYAPLLIVVANRPLIPSPRTPILFHSKFGSETKLGSGRNTSKGIFFILTLSSNRRSAPHPIFVLCRPPRKRETQGGFRIRIFSIFAFAPLAIARDQCDIFHDFPSGAAL